MYCWQKLEQDRISPHSWSTCKLNGRPWLACPFLLDVLRQKWRPGINVADQINLELPDKSDAHLISPDCSSFYPKRFSSLCLGSRGVLKKSNVCMYEFTKKIGYLPLTLIIFTCCIIAHWDLTLILLCFFFVSAQKLYRCLQIPWPLYIYKRELTQITLNYNT